MTKPTSIEAAAALLRLHGWTCTPPPVDAPYRSITKERYVWRGGTLAQQRMVAEEYLAFVGSRYPESSDVDEWRALGIRPPLLRRLVVNGFTPSDVAHTPDSVLLSVRNLGPERLAHLRAVVPYAP